MYLLPDLSWDHTPMLFGSDEYMEKLVLFLVQYKIRRFMVGCRQKQFVGVLLLSH
jgi:hypothetical protein